MALDSGTLAGVACCPSTHQRLEDNSMFIGISNSNRRRVLREALTIHKELIESRPREVISQNDVDDLDHINALLREVNAAESLGKPVAPGASTVPSHYGDR